MQKRMKWWIAGAGAVLVVVAVGLSRARGTQVQVVNVARSGIVQSIAATGRLNAPARMDVGADVTATVLEVRVREGDAVRAGQVLVRLQDTEALAMVQQARAALAEAQGRAVQQTRVTAPVANQAVVQAQAAFQNAERVSLALAPVLSAQPEFFRLAAFTDGLEILALQWQMKCAGHGCFPIQVLMLAQGLGLWASVGDQTLWPRCTNQMHGPVAK